MDVLPEKVSTIVSWCALSLSSPSKNIVHRSGAFDLFSRSKFKGGMFVTNEQKMYFLNAVEWGPLN